MTVVFVVLVVGKIVKDMILFIVVLVLDLVGGFCFAIFIVVVTIFIVTIILFVSRQKA